MQNISVVPKVFPFVPCKLQLQITTDLLSGGGGGSVAQSSWSLQALQAPLCMGFPRQKYWIGLPFPSPGDIPNLGTEPVSPALAGGFFVAEPPEKE